MGVKLVYFIFALVVSASALPVEKLPHENFDLLVYGDRSTRIVGGTPAEEGKDPHMVVLTTGVYVTGLLCGGSLISQRTVLTAAHCIRSVSNIFQGPLLESFRGHVGTNVLNHGMAGAVTFAFSTFAAHPDYDHSVIKDDIGVLITRFNVPLSEKVQVIPLDYSFIEGNVPARVAGFGRIIRNGPIPNELLELELTTIDGEDCVREVPIAAAAADPPISVPAVDPQKEICTFHSVGHGMCNGDSGSALARRDTGQQIGIVSWGVPCAIGGPDMFVRVSTYADWLAENVV